MKTVLAILLLTAGCGSSPTHREPDEYTGCGTDEQWQVFDDNEPSTTVSATMAPQVTVPAAGATIAASAKPILRWNQDANDPGANDGDVIHTNGPGCNDCCPEFNIGALKALHEPAVSGDTYDLQITVGGQLLWRVVTTLQEWTPPDSLWTQMKGKSVSVKIYRMTILVNQLKQGPYVAATPFTFTVES